SFPTSCSPKTRWSSTSCCPYRSTRPAGPPSAPGTAARTGSWATSKWRTPTSSAGARRPTSSGSSASGSTCTTSASWSRTSSGRTRAGFSLYNDRRLEYDAEAQSNYWAHRRGGDVTLGRPLGAFTRGSLTFRAYSTETEPVAGGAHVPTSHLTHSIIASVRTDTSDHLLYPTEGFRSLFSVEAATPAFGGDTEFTKYQASFSRYVKVGRNDQTWAFRVLAGVGTGTIPVNEKFRVGGAETVRGYRYGAMQGDR